MKKKINIQMLGITILAIVITLITTLFIFYNLFQKQVKQELKSYTKLLMQVNDTSKENFWEQYPKSDAHIRITIINREGQVEYDNSAKVDNLDNHKERPEVAEAFRYEEGEAIRRSETLNQVTFYYAFRINDEYVLRVAKKSESVWSVFASTLPFMLVVVVVVIVVCACLTKFMTKKLLMPVEEMVLDLEEMKNVPAYKELLPFIDKIHKQHEDIIKSSKMRQEFTANVSHELKTPLTAISGYSELIESGMANKEDMIHFGGEIHRSSQRLLTLINDIIRLSELDAGEEGPEMEQIDLYVMAQNCVDMLQFSATKHDVTISLHGESAIIYANRYMMEEVLFNLCDNAIRYNYPKGKVEVEVSKLDDGGCVLKVQDTGIGISPKHQERIFERFYRVDKSRSKKSGGTGLGLAIVKHIVAKHDAQLLLESEEGHGTTICIQFQGCKDTDAVL